MEFTCAVPRRGCMILLIFNWCTHGPYQSIDFITIYSFRCTHVHSIFTWAFRFVNATRITFCVSPRGYYCTLFNHAQATGNSNGLYNLESFYAHDIKIEFSIWMSNIISLISFISFGFLFISFSKCIFLTEVPYKYNVVSCTIMIITSNIPFRKHLMLIICNV